ncbi:MAG: hypothetical protein LQ351_006127, partial [Letrouitia transgressa]
YESGHSSLLLNLAGTLPVSFRGTTYMFPISSWVPHEYPRTVPITFVTPTKNMAVRPGQYISGEEIFAKEPPVISRQDQIPPPRPTHEQNGMPPPIPPLPPELGRPGPSNSQPQLLPSPTSQPPPPPPKPYDTSNQQRPLGGPPIPPHPSQQGSTADPLGDKYQRPAPDPRQQTVPNAAQPQRINSLRNEFLPSSNRQQPSQFTPRLASEMHSPVSPIEPRAFSGTQTSAYRQPPPHPAFQQQPSPASKNTPQPLQPQQRQQWNAVDSRPLQTPHHHIPVQQQAPKSKPPEDLLTSPFEASLPTPSADVAPPPIPPNPQKDALLQALSKTLTQQIQSTHASNMAALPPLRAQQAALNTALSKIKQEISQLNSLESLLDSNEQILHQAMRDADNVLENAKQRNVPAVEDVLVAPTVVAGQLYDVVIEEKVLEESRGIVGKALDRGRIDGDVWAKQTRSLAREEFLKKALIKKIARDVVSRPPKPAHVPNEVLCNIFAKLVGDCQTLGRCALVSRRFSELVRPYTFREVSITFIQRPIRICNFFSLEQSFNERPASARLVQSFALYFNFEGLRLRSNVFGRINCLLGKLDHLQSLHLEQVGPSSPINHFEITCIRGKYASPLRHATLLWDYGLNTARSFIRLWKLESLSVQNLISAQQLVQLKHDQGNPELSFSLNFLPRLPLPEDMTKPVLRKLGNVVKVQALLTGSDGNRGLAPGVMEMTGPLSPAAVSRTFGPVKSTLQDLELTSGGMLWPSHDQTRLDVSDFVALRILHVPCNCLFPPDSESRSGVYKLLPKSLQTLKIFFGCRVDKLKGFCPALIVGEGWDKKNFSSAEMDKGKFGWLAELALYKEVQLPALQHIILSEGTGNEDHRTGVGFQMGVEGLPRSIIRLCAMHKIKAEVESMTGTPKAVLTKGLLALMTGRLPVG